MAGIDLAQLELAERLGKGGQGIVYRARLGAGEVAVKILVPTSEAGAAQITERLARFARANHASVPAILAHGTLADAPPNLAEQLRDMPREAIYVVMAFVPHGTLADLPRPSSEPQAVAALWLAAEALATLPLGVFHGDVRTPNIALRGGAVTLLDPDLTRDPSAEDDLRDLGKLAVELCPTSPTLRQLGSELAGPPPLPRLAEVRERLRDLATSLGVKPEDLRALPLRQTAERSMASEAAPPLRSRTRPLPLAAGGAGCLLLGAFGPFLFMRSPLRPAPRTELKSESPLVTTGRHGVYDTTGKVHHDGPIQELKCGEDFADGRRGFIMVTIAETVPRIAISKAGFGLLWQLDTPAVGDRYCFDVPEGNYDIEQDRELPSGETQRDVKNFWVDVRNPRRIETSEQMMYAPVAGVAKPPPWGKHGFWRWWWNGFE